MHLAGGGAEALPFLPAPSISLATGGKAGTGRPRGRSCARNAAGNGGAVALTLLLLYDNSYRGGRGDLSPLRALPCSYQRQEI